MTMQKLDSNKTPVSPEQEVAAAADVAAEGKEDGASRRKVVMETTWTDRGAVASDGGSEAAGAEDGQGASPTFGRNLATITTVDSEEGDSTYSFSSQVRCVLSPDGSTITVKEYAGRGVFIDGIDLGNITYKNIGEWTSALNPDRTFQASGTVAWSDKFDKAVPLNITFRATLLEGNQLAFVSNTTQGETAYEDRLASKHSVSVDVPACW